MHLRLCKCIRVDESNTWIPWNNVWLRERALKTFSCCHSVRIKRKVKRLNSETHWIRASQCERNTKHLGTFIKSRLSWQAWKSQACFSHASWWCQVVAWQALSLKNVVGRAHNPPGNHTVLTHRKHCWLWSSWHEAAGADLMGNAEQLPYCTAQLCTPA